MSNDCMNYLDILGNDKDIDRFLKAITKGPQLKRGECKFAILDNLFPQPDNIGARWETWSRTNWGSKGSDMGGYIGDRAKQRQSLSFCTAWSPIVPGITKVSEQFPRLGFVLVWEEGGSESCGVAVMKNGELIVEIDGVYPTLDDDDDDYEKLDNLVASVVDALTEQGIDIINEHFLTRINK